MSGSDPTPRSQEGSPGGFRAFWTTLPGILTGSAALITAIVTLLTLWKGSADPPHDPGIDQVTSAPGVTRSQGPSSPPDSSSTGIFAQGRLTMRSPDSADLETGLVGSSPPGYDLYLHCSGIACILNAMSSLMTVADGASDEASCINALSARRDQALYLEQLSQGQTVCVQTAEGHVGALQILDLPGVGSIEFVFSYTLWR